MNILVAGLTGQLGIGMVESLHEDSGVELLPLVRPVRGRDPVRWLGMRLSGARDLAGNFVTGDVTQPQWGIDDATLQQLAGRVDAVVDLAAETNWAASDSVLHRTNTVGALHGLRVAQALHRLRGRCTLYCYAGSVYVAGGRRGWIPETTFGPDAERTRYEQSKWAAERMLIDAARHGEVSLAIVRMGTLTGDSRTGTTLRRNALYMLADRSSMMPGGVMPAAAGGRVDALPRDIAGGYFLRAVQRAHEERASTPQVYHLCAGESAPTLRSLLAVARSLDDRGTMPVLRTVSAPARFILWLSQNADRVARLDAFQQNAVIGLRYVGLDRVFERSRLAALLGGDVPSVPVELIARQAFGLDGPAVAPVRSHSALARFAE